MTMTTTVQRRHRALRMGGFTLVEVLVALAVVAIALPALLTSMAEQLRSQAYMRDKSMAHWVAMNTITELNLQNEFKGYLPRKKKTGSATLAEREWFWVMEVKKTPNDAVTRVDVSVRLDQDAKAAPLVTLSNFYQRSGSLVNLATPGAGVN